jgi:O-antigen/teichoic acid export membrane protein
MLAEKRNPGVTADVVKYSWAYVIIGLGFVLMTELDVVMLGMLSNKTDVAYYAAAKQIANKLPGLAFAVALAATPVFARLEDGQASELRALLIRSIGYTLLLMIPPIAVLVLFSTEVAVLLFGENYQNAGAPLVILMAWVALVCPNAFLNSVLDYRRKGYRRAAHFVLSIATNIVLNSWLIPRYGARGAAVATLLSTIPYVLLNAVSVARSLHDPATSSG